MDIIEWSKKLGNYDSTEIMNFISSLPVEAWDEFTDRQTRFPFHEQTKCIAGVFADRSDYPSIKLDTFKYTDELSKLCYPIVECFTYFYFSNPTARQFRVTTAMIVMMPPNSKIGSHSDTHPYFGEAHRLHWCLDGDYEKMDFLIAGNKIPMQKGDLIEINNRMPHEVIYKGDVPRYNLIIDFMRQ
tara:strand:+ start:2933 stop:3490 length:558 start_codon:yes stop_codon:yes gene_type:complete